MTTHKRYPERTRLLVERKGLLKELNRLREEIRSEVDLEPDEGDEQITEHETAAIVTAILEKRLHDIEYALSLIKQGTYAYCERCGEKIEAARLAAKPDARYCIDCQQTVERIIYLSQPRAEVEYEFEF